MELRGSFLIAMPDLLDPNFHRTVVLVVEHDDEEGTVGLVINRPTEVAAREFCASLDIEWTGESEAVVHAGGPVQPTMGWILLGTSESTVDSGFVADGIWASTSRRTLEWIAAQKVMDRRVFGGYAGWAPGQLADELRAGAWLTCPAIPELVFHAPPDDVWGRALRSMGVDPAALVGGSRELS